MLIFSAMMVVVASSSNAFACDPGNDPIPRYSLDIVAPDAPDCVTFSDSSDYAAVVQVDNGCQAPARIEALECDDCSEPLEVAPGEREYFTVDARQIEESRINEQTLAWSVGDDEGVIEVVSTYNGDNGDDSDPCAPLCTVTTVGTAAPTGAPAILFLLMLFVGSVSIRRAWA